MHVRHCSFDKLSAVPLADTAERLHEAYKQRFLDSFIQLVNYVQETLAKDYKAILIRLDQLETQSSCSFISPWLYCQYFKLLEFVREDEVTQVEQLIQGLSDKVSWIIPKRVTVLGLQEDWEKKVFLEEVSSAFGEDCLNALTPDKDELPGFELEVIEAMKLIASADSEMHREINCFASVINLVKSEVNVGATSPKFFGAIYLSLPDEYKHLNQLMLIEHLVHESSHLYLNSVLAFDPLVLNEAEERFVSPIRMDLRPMLGIYHAAFVLSRVIRVFKQMCSLKLQDHGNLTQSIDSLTKKYKAAFETISNKASLTKVGKQILLSTSVY